MVCMSPHIATIHPAPVYGRSSRTGSVKPVGALISAGSWESDMCVLAMQIGVRPRPAASSRSAWARAAGASSTPAGTVGLRGDRGDLLVDRRVELVEEPRLGNGRRSGGNDGLGQLDCAFTSTLEAVVDGHALHRKLRSKCSSRLDLGCRVLREPVDGDDARKAEGLDDPERGPEVGEAPLELREAALDVAAVVLQRLDGRHEHDDARAEAAEAADDVDELLEAHVGPEPALGHDPVAELEAEAVGDERVVAVRDVGERAAVEQSRLPFHRLHEVRLERLLEQHRHRAGGADLLRRHSPALIGRADGDRAEPGAQVGEIARYRDDRHHLRGSGDVEAGLAWKPVGAAAEADDRLAKDTVVHVDAAAPGDRVRIEAEVVSLQEVRVDHRCEQVVGRADRVDVAGEVEVDLLHRHHLCAPAAGATALEAEDRPERGLPQAEHRLLADRAEPLGERDRGRRLALPEPGRRHRRDRDDPAVGHPGKPVDRGELDLGSVRAVREHLVGLESKRMCQLCDHRRIL